LGKVKKIKFKDEEQKNKFMSGVNNFKGKIVYEDEKEDNSLFSRIEKRCSPGGMGE
jgi:hemerythrin-like domain-containing protein